MKHRLRVKIKQVLSNIPAGQADEQSRRACHRLTQMPEFQNASTIMLYMPIQNEADCMPMADQAWKDGKTVLIPKINHPHRTMAAVRYNSPGTAMRQDQYGIREPIEAQVQPVENIDLIVIPALACDRSGNRLGRGGGFYDRFLAQPAMKAITCSLVFDQQLLDNVPVETNDWPIDIVVTDKTVLRFAQRRGTSCGCPKPL